MPALRWRDLERAPGWAGPPMTGELPDVGSMRSFSWQAVSPAQVTNDNIAKLFR